MKGKSTQLKESKIQAVRDGLKYGKKLDGIVVFEAQSASKRLEKFAFSEGYFPKIFSKHRQAQRFHYEGEPGWPSAGYQSSSPVPSNSFCLPVR